jgi:two-component system cell cycle sensor histidine kinase/response regulator CckA
MVRATHMHPAASLRSFAKAASAAVFLGGFVSLTGWWLDNDTLKSLIPENFAMRPNAALAFLLAGFSLWILRTELPGQAPAQRLRRLAQLAALGVALIGLLTLSEHALGRNLGIDQLLFGAATARDHTPYPPGRLSPLAALNFSLIGCALLLLNAKSRLVNRFSEVFTVTAAVLSLFAVCWHIYRIGYLSQKVGILSLAAALSFLLLSTGILCARPESGMMALFTSNTLGGTVLRRTFPAAVAAPLVLAWLTFAGSRLGFYSDVVGVALYAALSTLAFSAIIYANARSTHAVDLSRQSSEAALRNNENRFRSLLESSPDAMVITDQAGRIVLVNRTAENLFGYQRQELLGQTLDILLPERIRDTHAMHFDEYASRPRHRSMGSGLELCGRHKDGREIPLEISLSPLETSEGILFSSAIRDIRQRKQDEEALRRSEAEYRSLVQGAPYGILRCTTDGRLLTANPALAEMLGYDVAEDMLALNIGADIACDPELCRHLLEQSHTGIRGAEVRWKRKDGKELTVQLSGRAVRDESGKTLYYEMISENVTEQRRLEEEFRQAQKLEAIGRLAGGVAHDFNNLLGVIIGYSELLLEQEGLDEALTKKIEQIRKAGQRAASVTGQLLAFSRKQVLQPQALNLNSVVSDTGKMLNRLIGEDIELITVLDPRLGPVKADPTQIEQVILNLAINARDAMPQGGRLTIKTANLILQEAVAYPAFTMEPGRYVSLTISDTGAGMSPEIQSHIFEPFFTTKEEGKGTGMGLAMVYGIVKQSGGYIACDSAPGKSTTFSIYLPLAEELSLDEEPHAPQPKLPQGSETILLVEDAEPLRILTQEFLLRLGYRVLEASSGSEALHLAQQHKGTIDLLLTDIVMPGMSGRELAMNVADRHPQVKVLYISGYTDDAIVRHGIEERAVSLLMKPFTLERLAHKLRTVLD